MQRLLLYNPPCPGILISIATNHLAAAEAVVRPDRHAINMYWLHEEEVAFRCQEELTCLQLHCASEQGIFMRAIFPQLCLFNKMKTLLTFWFCVVGLSSSTALKSGSDHVRTSSDMFLTRQAEFLFFGSRLPNNYRFSVFLAA